MNSFSSLFIPLIVLIGLSIYPDAKTEASSTVLLQKKRVLEPSNAGRSQDHFLIHQQSVERRGGVHFRSVLSDLDASLKASFERSVSHRDSINYSVFESGDQLIAQNSESAFRIASSAIVSIRAGNRVGAGSLVSEDGLIVTNAQLVANQQTVTVRLTDGREFEGTVVARDDAELDLAVVKIQSRGNLPYIRLQDQAVQVGQMVYILEPDDSPTVSATLTTAMVSRIDRNEGLIQTDAPSRAIAPGAPLLNQRGELVGLPSQRLTSNLSVSAGFILSVPVERAQNLLAAATNPQSLASNQCAEARLQQAIAQLVDNPERLAEIIACGSAAVPSLVSQLKDGFGALNDVDQYRQILVLTALGEIGPDARSALPALRLLLAGDSLRTHYDTLLYQTYANIGGLDALQRITNDDTQYIGLRYQMALTMIEIGETQAAIPALASVARGHECDGIHSSALYELQKLNPTLAQQIEREHQANTNQDDFVVSCSADQVNNLRESTAARMQRSAPAICRYAIFRAAFAGRCR